MTVCTATFDAGSNGATVSAGDAGAATAWDSVGSFGGNTLTYSNAHSYGRLAAKFDNTAAPASQNSLIWSTALGTVTEHYGRVYLYATYIPTGSYRVVQDGNGQFMVFINSSGLVWSIDQGGTAVATTVPIALNQWVRIEWHWVNSITVGQVEIRLFNSPNSTSPTEAVSTAANRNTLASATSLEIGLGSGGGETGPIWLDNVVAGATSWPGPAPVPAPTATFETGVNGAAITTGDAGSATAFNTVNAISGPVTYDNTHSYGRLAAKFVVTGAAATSVGWSTAFGTLTDHYGRLYLYLPAFPGSAIRLVSFTPGSGFAPQIRIGSDGKLVTTDSGAGGSAAMSTAIALNQWVRIEWHIVHGASGSMEVKLFNGPDSAAATATLTTSSIDVDTNATGIDVGWNSGSSGTETFWVDNIVAGAPFYPGPTNITPGQLDVHHVRGLW